MRRRGVLYIVSAPSGAGKTTLCREVLKRIENLRFSVSYTTRPPRPGEEDGRDYFFVSRQQFLDMINKGEFLEWAEVHGNLYGTSRRYVEQLLAEGYDVLLDIDTQGARQIRSSGVEAVFIFILPPDIKTLEERLRARATETEESLRKRLSAAKRELHDYKMFDYVIINNKLEEAIEDLFSVVRAERLRIHRLDHDFLKNKFFK